MNDKNKIKWEKAPLSFVRIILLQILYWGIYMWVMPRIVIRILLNFEFSIQSITINAEILNYAICAVFAVIIMLPLLKKERHLKIGKMAYTLIINLSLMYVLNIIFSVVMALFEGPEASVNQSGLNTIMAFDKSKFLLMVVFLAPVLEELVFRGGIFRTLRSRNGFWISAIISSLMFGFMHVLNALLLGEMVDLVYVILYSGLGIMLARSYEINNSIYACIILHMAYNLMASVSILLT